MSKFAFPKETLLQINYFFAENFLEIPLEQTRKSLSVQSYLAPPTTDQRLCDYFAAQQRITKFCFPKCLALVKHILAFYTPDNTSCKKMIYDRIATVLSPKLHAHADLVLLAGLLKIEALSWRTEFIQAVMLANSRNGQHSNQSLVVETVAHALVLSKLDIISEKELDAAVQSLRECARVVELVECPTQESEQI